MKKVPGCEAGHCVSTLEQAEDELVLVVRTKDFLEKFGPPYWFGRPDLVVTIVEWCEKEGFLVPRHFAENDPDYQFIQPIAYLLIGEVNTTDTWDRRYYLHSRSENQAESRLHGSFSLGIGGHVSVKDMEWVVQENNTVRSATGSILRSLAREVSEEVELPSFNEGAFDVTHAHEVAAVYDPDYEVSRRHLGIVYETYSEWVVVRETRMMKGRFHTIQEIRQERRLENWSQMILYKYLVR